MGNSVDEDMALYARYDFKTENSFLLIMGTDASVSQDRAIRLLHAKPQPSSFHVIFTLQSTTLAVLEFKRWDWTTQLKSVEVETGFTRLKRPGVLSPRKLNEWNQDSVITELESGFMAWAAARMISNFEAFLRHLNVYQEACEHSPQSGLGEVQLRNLQTACQTNLDLVQSQHDQTQKLRRRLNTHLDVIKTLKAQRNDEVNIEIAQATKHDSEINIQIADAVRRDSERMRQITFITMLFLPATFVATFFSIVFFHVENEQCVPSMQQIW